MTKTFTHTEAVARIADQLTHAESAELKACAIVIAYAATHSVTKKNGDVVAPVDVLTDAAGGARFDAISDMPKQAAAKRYDVLPEQVNAKGHGAAHACANRVGVIWRKACHLMSDTAKYDQKVIRESGHAAHKAMRDWATGVVSALDGMTLPQAEAHVYDLFIASGLDSVNAIKRKHKAHGTAQPQVQSDAAPQGHDEQADVLDDQSPDVPADVRFTHGFTTLIAAIRESDDLAMQHTVLSNMAHAVNEALGQVVAAQEKKAA